MARTRGGMTALAVAGGSAALLLAGRRLPVPRWLLWPGAALGAAVAANEFAGKPGRCCAGRCCGWPSACRGCSPSGRWATEHGFAPGSVDLVFVDHAKDEYLPDLLRILDEGWLHPGSVVVGDNVKVPGAPEFRAYLQEHDGRTFRTVEHAAHVEYQSMIKDIVTESEYLGVGL